MSRTKGEIVRLEFDGDEHQPCSLVFVPAIYGNAECAHLRTNTRKSVVVDHTMDIRSVALKALATEESVRKMDMESGDLPHILASFAYQREHGIKVLVSVKLITAGRNVRLVRIRKVFRRPKKLHFTSTLTMSKACWRWLVDQVIFHE